MQCPYCFSDHAIRRGTSENKSKKKVRYQCKNCNRYFRKEDEVAKVRTPNILLFDIETLPMKIYAWDLFPTYTPPTNIIQDYSILSWGAKWLFNDTIESDCLTSKEAIARDDHRIVVGIWKLLDEAHIVIAHNGKKFDVRKLNTRFIQHGLPPPSPYMVIDTWEAAKKRFGFSSNKLDYINKYLGLPQKEETNFQLWIDCDNGDTKALKTMLNYNIQDVAILEETYVNLRPWIPQHPNLNVYVTTDEAHCPHCLSKELVIKGLYATPANLYRAFRCSACGTIGRTSNTALTTEKRKNMVRVS